MKFVANDRRPVYRLAVVVSKKVSKSAVVRNRIRRRLYEVFRQHAAEFDRPYDIVLTVFHEQIAAMPAAELEQVIVTHLRQAEIIPPVRKS